MSCTLTFCAISSNKMSSLIICCALINFLEELDKRVEDSLKANKKKHVPQRMERVPSTHLSTLPPTTPIQKCSKWAVSREWLKGTSKLLFHALILLQRNVARLYVPVE